MGAIMGKADAAYRRLFDEPDGRRRLQPLPADTKSITVPPIDQFC